MDAGDSAILERIAVAVERLAEHIAPLQVTREKRPATLTSATYTREERERQQLAETLKRKEAQSPGRHSAPTRTDF